jgi:hypothetical protein
MIVFAYYLKVQSDEDELNFTHGSRSQLLLQINLDSRRSSPAKCHRHETRCQLVRTVSSRRPRDRSRIASERISETSERNLTKLAKFHPIKSATEKSEKIKSGINERKIAHEFLINLILIYF